MDNYFTMVTLVDITETGVMRGHTKERNQQANFETVIQCVGIGAQPTTILQRVITADMTNDVFGEMFVGQQRVWLWIFSVEHKDVFRKDDDPVGVLYDYIENVPFIAGLDETTGFLLPVFSGRGALKNTHFIEGSPDLRLL